MKTYIITVRGIPNNGNAVLVLSKLYNLSEERVKLFMANFNDARDRRARFNYDTAYLAQASIEMSGFSFIEMESTEQHR